MSYRVTGAAGTAVVERDTLLGAVFHALTCSVRDEAHRYEIADETRALGVAFRGRLYVGAREIAVDELVRAGARVRA